MPLFLRNFLFLFFVSIPFFLFIGRAFELFLVRIVLLYSFHEFASRLRDALRVFGSGLCLIPDLL